MQNYNKIKKKINTNTEPGPPAGTNLCVQNTNLCVENANLRVENAKLCVENAKLCVENAKLCVENVNLNFGGYCLAPKLL